MTPVNDNNPIISSNGGGASASINVLENDLYVSTVVASDADLPAETLTYSIIGGVDAARFAIDGSTGVLTFVSSPDFEAPTDVGADNIYNLIVQASDGTWTDSQSIAVTVINVSDSGQYLDLFSSNTYSNSDGTEVWSTSWVESEGNGASAGDIKVSAGSLKITAKTLNTNLYREVDLSNAISANLNFTYNSALSGTETIQLQISGDGGSNYATLDTFSSASNPGAGSSTYDISSYLASNTRVRFLVTSIDGNAKDLAIDNVQMDYVPNSPPTITSDGGGATATVSVAENSTAVTTVTAVDGDLPAQTLTYNIVGGADAGKFSIDSGSGALTFIAAANYESPTDVGGDNVYDLTVQVSDGISTDTQAIAVTVLDLNESPTMVTNTGGTVAEGSTGTAITTAMLQATDVDDSSVGLTYGITSVTGNGTLRLSGTVLGISDTFTQADIDAGLVTYDHNGSETTSDSFGFSLADGGEDGSLPATGTFAITVNPVNDEQSLDTNAGLTLAEGATATITSSELTTSDVDNTASQLVYTVDAAPANGTVYLSGVALNAGDTFTQADIDGGQITYTHDGGETTSDSFDFTVNDGAGTSTSSTFNFTVTPVNDEQSLDTNAGLTLSEGGTATITNTELATIDVDNSAAQLVYTVDAVPSNGTVYLSGVALNAGDTFTQADIDGGQITYTHDGGETTSDSFDFTVDDGAGTTTSSTFNFTVTPVNDEQSLDTNAGLTLSEGGTATITSSELATSDVDNTAAQLVYTVDTATTNGTVYLSGVALNAGDTFTQADIDGGQITYTHDGGETTSDSFDYTVDDGAGTTTSSTFNFTVTPVNDEQSLDTNTGLTLSEGGTTAITNAELATSDVDNTAAQLVYTVDAAPTSGTVYLSGVALNAGDTFTQADIDGGQITYTHDGGETTSDSFDFTVDDGAGTTTSSTFNFTVTSVNDEQSLDTNAGLTLSEGGTGTITSSQLATSDVDNTAGQLVYTVDAATSNGTVYLSGVALNAGDTFTQADIDGGQITYTHNGGETTSDSFDFTVDDGAGTTTSSTFNFTVTPVNDEQSLDANAGLTLSEGGTATIT